MQEHHNGEIGGTFQLSEITTQQLHKLKKILRAENEEKKRNKSERPLVSLGQGEYRRDVMEGDLG